MASLASLASGCPQKVKTRTTFFKKFLFVLVLISGHWGYSGNQPPSNQSLGLSCCHLEPSGDTKIKTTSVDLIGQPSWGHLKLTTSRIRNAQPCDVTVPDPPTNPPAVTHMTAVNKQTLTKVWLLS